jgi:hypothetical protein
VYCSDIESNALGKIDTSIMIEIEIEKFVVYSHINTINAKRFDGLLMVYPLYYNLSI